MSWHGLNSDDLDVNQSINQSINQDYDDILLEMTLHVCDFLS